jgi:hypothetical protein
MANNTSTEAVSPVARQYDCARSYVVFQIEGEIRQYQTPALRKWLSQHIRKACGKRLFRQGCGVRHRHIPLFHEIEDQRGEPEIDSSLYHGDGVSLVRHC